MIIDFHTHVFPPKVAAKAIPHLAKEGGTQPYLDGTLGALQTSMEQNGVSHSVTLPVATNAASVPSINDYAISQLNETGLIPFGAMHPDFEEYEKELERIRQAGLKGIKLHPDYQYTDVDDPKMVRVMEAACRLGLIVLLHGGFDIAFPKLHRSPPSRLANVIGKLRPELVVVAHYGGHGYGEEYRKCLMGSGVYIDTSYAHKDFREDCLETLRWQNPDRILFGTDSPWDGQGEGISFIKSLQMGVDLEEKIFCRNAMALLGMEK